MECGISDTHYKNLSVTRVNGFYHSITTLFFRYNYFHLFVTLSLSGSVTTSRQNSPLGRNGTHNIIYFTKNLRIFINFHKQQKEMKECFICLKSQVLIEDDDVKREILEYK